VTFEERMQRIEHNLDLLAAAQERLSAADERLAEQIAADRERSAKRLAALGERIAALEDAEERLAAANVLIMNSLETRAEWEARMTARAEVHEKNFARIETNLAEISDKLNGLIGYVDGFKRDNRPPA
jgi:chromosome segregation ATPase